MKTNGVFFLILSLIYFLQEWGLYARFRSKYGMKLRGESAGAEGIWQYGYTATIYLVSFYYLAVGIYAVSGFDFWGLVSPIYPLNRPLFHMTGFVLGLLFLAGIAVSRLHLGAAWRVGVDADSSADLVTGGIYRFVRHPYFTALLGFELSVFFILPSAVTLLAFLQSLVAVCCQAFLEEQFLKDRYTEAYAAYMKTTGRFLPRIK